MPGVTGYQSGRPRGGGQLGALRSAARTARRVVRTFAGILQYLNGAFAQYIRIPQRFVQTSTHRLDPDLPYEVAALVEPLACVVHGVDACGLGDGAGVLVYGAGPIGLLLTAVLAARGHGVVAADPNPSRLDVARVLGARDTVEVSRGGGQADRLRSRSLDGDGFDCAIDATGVPAVWQDAVACVRPGGVVNLFGGCPPGTRISLDTALVHYNELTIKGAYHHRPATVSQALDMLTRKTLDPRPLLSAEVPLEGLEKSPAVDDGQGGLEGGGPALIRRRMTRAGS